MSIEIGLQYLALDGYEVPPRPGMIEHLLNTAHRVYADARIDDGLRLSEDRRSFAVVLPDGTGDIYANYAVFPLNDLHSFSVRMVFEIAKAGDMAVVGEGLTILTNPDQPHPSQVSDGSTVHVCQSPEELRFLLDRWLNGYREFRDAALTGIPQSGERTWVPGSRPEAPMSFIYVEARVRETARKHQTTMYKHYQNACKAGSPNLPSQGSMIAEFWRLETPAGRVFFVYGYGGDKDRWEAVIRAFAAAEGRLVGRIENFDTFVQDDGQKFPLANCRATKVKE